MTDGGTAAPASGDSDGKNLAAEFGLTEQFVNRSVTEVSGISVGAALPRGGKRTQCG